MNLSSNNLSSLIIDESRTQFLEETRFLEPTVNDQGLLSIASTKAAFTILLILTAAQSGATALTSSMLPAQAIESGIELELVGMLYFIMSVS